MASVNAVWKDIPLDLYIQTEQVLCRVVDVRETNNIKVPLEVSDTTNERHEKPMNQFNILLSCLIICPFMYQLLVITSCSEANLVVKIMKHNPASWVEKYLTQRNRKEYMLWYYWKIIKFLFISFRTV